MIALPGDTSRAWEIKTQYIKFASITTILEGTEFQIRILRRTYLGININGRIVFIRGVEVISPQTQLINIHFSEMDSIDCEFFTVDKLGILAPLLFERASVRT
jgi:hypothetical protein